MSIKLLLTGGTIDKHYNESNGNLNFTTSHIQEILELGRNHSDVEINQLMLKDSLEMDDFDREKILQACVHSDQNQIIITHGTDTMVETASVLADEVLEKTIVLVGAMVPFVFKHSDAIFNMGFALAAVQTMPHGVYVSMNGKVFKSGDVIKNKTLGVFENVT